MLDAPTQDTRIAKLTTPLGDSLVLLRLDGTEGLSETFEWRVEALAKDESTEIDPNGLIGHPCHVEMSVHGGNIRYFHGLCTDVRWLGSLNRRNRFELVLQPWFWMLKRQSNTRFFMDSALQDIMSQVFNDLGFSDFEFRSASVNPQIHYCVQYQESNYDFVCRLMEKYGYYYFFEHSSSKHLMVITDSKAVHSEAPGYASVPYFPEGNVQRDRDHLYQVSNASRLRSSKVAVQDYNYETASTSLAGDAEDPPQHGHPSNEFYDYPAGYDAAGDAATLAQITLQSERATAQRIFASGTTAGLFTGCLFEIKQSPLPGGDDKYVLVRASHSVESDEYRTTFDISDEPPYRGSYEAIQKDIQFRAPKLTKWPCITGPVVGKVAGDGEIDVDDKGRILVSFPWERNGHAAYRIRVAQVWAGAGWGGVYIPRVGQEVVVHYEFGDPDRPLVTGAVYNSDNTMPYPMPDDKTKSTLKSETSEGGGGNNEIRFEDKSGQEEIYVHAQKDMLREVEHDDTLDVKHDQMITIKNNRTEEVTEGDETLNVKQGKRAVTIKGDDSLQLKMGNHNVKIDMGNQTVKLAMGNHSLKASLGKSNTEAMQSIELKVGGSSIKVDMMGVTIKGPMIKLDAQMMLQLKSAIMAQLQGSAMVQISGGMLMIG